MQRVKLPVKQRAVVAMAVLVAAACALSGAVQAQTSNGSGGSKNAPAQPSQAAATPTQTAGSSAVPIVSIVPNAAARPAAVTIGAPTTPHTIPTFAPMPAAALSTSPAPIEALEITNADKISVKIQGQTELSGEYRIADDQTISIPVLGRVSVARLDAAGLEKVLAERLSRLVGREAYVTVEVTEYRPVFVSGYVSRPGTAPWKPGMTVLQAVTVSGGTFRGANSNGIDGGTSTKVQRAIDDQKRVLATIARLSAERNGAAKMELPPRLIALVGRKEAQELIDAQLTSFLSRKSATEAQVSGLERAIALAKEELGSVRAQRERMHEQLKFRKAQFVQLKGLYNKQLLRLDRLSEEELRISDLEEKVASLGVSISRTDGTLVGLQRDLANIRQDRNAIIDTDLLKLERDAAQLELEIEAAGPIVRKITRPAADADGSTKEVVLYEIVRQDAAGAKTLPADRNTLLKPGDMLVVSVQ